MAVHDLDLARFLIGEVEEVHAWGTVLVELETFFRALQEGRTPAPGPEDALETLRLALAVTRSWREGRPVKIAEI